MTIEQVRTSYLNNKHYELEPLRAYQERNKLQKAEVKEPVEMKEYAERISEVRRLDERA